MSTALLLLAGSIDESRLAGASASIVAPPGAEWLTAHRASDDPLAATAYGSRWPYSAVVSIDAPGAPIADAVTAATEVLAHLGDAVDRAGSTAVVGSTHRIIDGRTEVALVYAIHRIEGITNEQYRTHWLGQHGPLAKELVPTEGYEQLHADVDASARLNAALGLDDSALDGVATCFFRNRDDFAAMLTARESSLDMNRIYEDELRFLDHGRSVGAMVRTTGSAGTR
ncbi:MAG: EthD domain-containing protein [Ilumatobacteraceae bacterium]